MALAKSEGTDAKAPKGSTGKTEFIPFFTHRLATKGEDP